MMEKLKSTAAKVVAGLVGLAILMFLFYSVHTTVGEDFIKQANLACAQNGGLRSIVTNNLPWSTPDDFHIICGNGLGGKMGDIKLPSSKIGTS